MTTKINAPSRLWIVRKPDEQGTIVAKFETTADDPGSIPYEIPESCKAFSVPDRSALTDKEADPSVLTQDERNVLGV